MTQHQVPVLGAFSWQPPVLATQNDPPTSPVKGDRYIVGSSPTGAWTGYAQRIAVYNGTGWSFIMPDEGWRAWDATANADKVFDGSVWNTATAPAHAVTHQSGGGDAIKLDDLASPDDNTDLDATTVHHGLLPKLGGGTTNFLRADGTWAAPAAGSSLGYALSLTAANLATLTDAATYYFGNKAAAAPATSQGQARVYVPKAGTIKAASIEGYFSTAGSDEAVSVYIRKNATTDYLIQSVGLDASLGLWQNGALNISMAAGDYFEIKVVCPTWVTNPANGRFSGSVYIE